MPGTTVNVNDVQSRPVVTKEDVNKRVVMSYPISGRWTGKLLDVFEHPNQAGQIVHRILIGNRAENLVGYSPRPLEQGEEFAPPGLSEAELSESATNSGAFIAAKSLKARKEGVVAASTPKEPKPTRYCASGSGKVTRGGAFAPGGDAQLKSLLLKVERGQAELSAIPEISKEYILATPHWAARWSHLFEDGFTPVPVAKKSKAATTVAAPAEPVVEEASDDEEFVEEEDVFEEDEDLDDEDLDDGDFEDEEEDDDSDSI